ncbi:hypothetical protein ABZS79_02665 [Streptomyces griseoloalbus]
MRIPGSFDPAPARPAADDPRDALERFGPAPVDLPATGPSAVRGGRTLG